MSPLDQGLISRWKLDEAAGTAAMDSGVAGNHGTLAGGASWLQPGVPAARYPNAAAIRFDGVDDHVVLGTRMLPANNQPQSVAFWVRYASNPPTGSGASQLFVSLTDNVLVGGSRLKLGFSGGALTAWAFGGRDLVAAPLPLPPPGWHHFAYTFDGTTHRLYIDGALRNSSTAAPDTGAVAHARLGNLFNGSEWFAGDLDDVRIYGRALGAPEVAALAQGMQ